MFLTFNTWLYKKKNQIYALISLQYKMYEDTGNYISLVFGMGFGAL